MKKLFQRICIFAFVLCFILLSSRMSFTAHAAGDLDRILEYTITVTPDAEDGSLFINYHLTWEVLDSTSEGPLSWIKIGIPNQNAEELTAHSENIRKISYYSEGGSYVRLDLDKDYCAGDILELDFSIHQHRMYEKQNGSRIYSFTPGWFDDIDVEKLSVLWDTEQVANASGDYEIDESFYRWNTGLSKGEKFTITIAYPENVFPSEDTKEILMTKEKTVPLVCMIVIPGIIGLVLLFHKSWGYRDTYSRHRGMGAVHTASRNRHRGGGHGHSCACACACACAGGGRAGCSKKDFH